MHISDDALVADIILFQKKVKKLEKAGPGAGMACAMASVHLRELCGEARQRGISHS